MKLWQEHKQFQNSLPISGVLDLKQENDIQSMSIRAFRAINDKNSSLRFALGHTKVLTNLNIKTLSAGDDKWMKNKYVYVIVAENNHKMLGGIRVHIANEKFPLPMEDGIGEQDKKVYEFVKKRRENGGTAELCGLWNSKEYPHKMGLALLLCLSALSISNQLPITTMLTIVARHTLNMAKKTGFEVYEKLGNEGQFLYPNEHFISKILGMVNTITLETAIPEYKNIIFDLRENPNQIGIRKFRETSLKVDYKLTLENGLK